MHLSRRTISHVTETEGRSVAPGDGVLVQRWANFIAKHPQAHVLLGRTRDITKWRSTDVVKTVATQSPTGRFAARRDLDDEQGYYLILIGFELEADAEKLARLLGASKVDPYAGYGSAYEFDPALLTPRMKRPTRVR